MKNKRIRRPVWRNKEDNNAFFSDKGTQPVQQQAQSTFFQPQLEIDPINSPMEKEADAAAKQVVNHPTAQESNTRNVQAKKIQRAAKDEEKPAAKLIQRAKEEEPAAKLIQRVEEEKPAAKLIQRVEEEKPAAKLIQRVEEEKTAAKLIQRKENDQQPKEQSVEAQIQQTKGNGTLLPEDIRIEMEHEFNADFSQVRIHTDASAIEMTQALQAQAFTHGYDIYFNEGRFDPSSKSGKELLAHELAHVVQQKGA